MQKMFTDLLDNCSFSFSVSVMPPHFLSGFKLLSMRFRVLDNIMCQLFSGVWLFVTPLSMGLFRQEYRSGLPFSSSRGSSRPRDWTRVSCLLHCKRILYLLSRWGSPMWCQLKRPFQPQLCNCLSSFTDLPLRPGFINFLLACNDLKMREISCSSISASSLLCRCQKAFKGSGFLMSR